MLFVDAQRGLDGKLVCDACLDELVQEFIENGRAKRAGGEQGMIKCPECKCKSIPVSG